MTSERLRVATSLEQLPKLSNSLRQGQLCWSAVRELTRVATADTEQAWLEFAADGKALVLCWPNQSRPNQTQTKQVDGAARMQAECVSRCS